MKLVILGLVLLALCWLLWQLLFKKDSSFRKNVTVKTFRIVVLGVIAVIVLFAFLTRQQLAIMINSSAQMPFLKEAKYDEQEMKVPEEGEEAFEEALVIEISTTEIIMDGITYDSFEEAQNPIREKAWNYKRAQLIDNYAAAETYLEVKSLLVSYGIEEGNIQENQNF
ncbi:hypothetical protein NXH67_08410 [Butyrivibrio sp. DSM 10294]|uniref:hypothetical protein n=1 Tax=Butyrivibrio sp. DSM 10294 TaxID=2972457 RepID=UPI00234F4905|nr:hypothetical protein [Butyrivibrio sp. DSM 10294]MDC7293535.1 hypothetical protein [Butyrivibrio sp. DSM 10294]